MKEIITKLIKFICVIIIVFCLTVAITSGYIFITSIKEFIVEKTIYHLMQGLTFIGYGTISLVVGCLVFYFGLGHFYKCENCNKKFCVQKDSSKLVDEKVFIKTEVNNYNAKKEVISISETYIPGTRKTYKVKYVCKNCGNVTYKYETKDKKYLTTKQMIND